MSAVRPNVAAKWEKVTHQHPQKISVLLSCKPRQHLLRFCQPKVKALLADFFKMKISYQSSLIRSFYQVTRR